MRTLRLIVLAGIAGSIGCAPVGPSAGGSPTADRDVITLEELQGVPTSTNLYDAIVSLRPSMIRSRGQMTLSPGESSYPRVYTDGQSWGDIDSLRSLASMTVRAVRYYSASEATTRFGTGHNAGVIEVLMKR